MHWLPPPPTSLAPPCFPPPMLHLCTLPAPSNCLNLLIELPIYGNTEQKSFAECKPSTCDVALKQVTRQTPSQYSPCVRSTIFVCIAAGFLPSDLPPAPHLCWGGNGTNCPKPFLLIPNNRAQLIYCGREQGSGSESRKDRKSSVKAFWFTSFHRNDPWTSRQIHKHLSRITFYICANQK